MNYKDAHLKVEERVEALMSEMTLNEKVGQINQSLYGWQSYIKTDNQYQISEVFKNEVNKYGGIGVLYGLFRADQWSGVTFETGVRGKETPKVSNMFQQYVIKNTRLGIPILMSTENPHGHQALDGYLLPPPIALGATFNPELVSKGFRISAKQLKASGQHLSLMSLLDVVRDPRWGRTEECFGEDPYLLSCFNKFIISTMQGNNDFINSDNIPVVAKHMCAQGECSYGINTSPASIGERELREIHLPAVIACIKQNVVSMMCAYNEIDGIPCHSNKWLLNDVIRKELHFNGFFMADGAAIDRLKSITGSNLKAGALAINSGIDLSLWDEGFKLLEEAINQNLISINRLNDAVRKILKLKFELGLFENPYVKEENKYTAISYKDDNTALLISRQSPILIKNDGILPLNKNIATIAVIGPNADDLLNQLGDYTPPVLNEYGVTVFNGIKKIAYNTTKVLYSKGCEIRDNSIDGFNDAINIAKIADVVVLVLGGSSTRDNQMEFDSNGAAIVSRNPMNMDCGEGVDVADLNLGGVQNNLFEQIYNLGKPIITVVIAGRPYSIGNIIKKSNAVLYAFYPGMQGGTAIAEIVFGDVNPSGKMPVSMPKSSATLPAFYNFKSCGSDYLSYVDEKTNIEVPFGFGLSYCSFLYRNITLNQKNISIKELKDGKKIVLKALITNESNFEGYETVQVYIHALTSSITRRIKELKGFKKVWFRANDTIEVQIELGYDEFEIWSSKKRYEVEKGEIMIYCGPDSNTREFVILDIIK